MKNFIYIQDEVFGWSSQAIDLGKYIHISAHMHGILRDMNREIHTHIQPQYIGTVT